jgi:hypothetical protein
MCWIAKETRMDATKYIDLFSYMGSFLSKEELETAVGGWLQVSVTFERTPG